MAKDVKIEIVGDASKFKSALTDASSASDKFSNKTKSNGEAMSNFGVGALAVGAAIGVGLFKAGEAASDLGESVNAVKVTFGDAAGGILKLGEDAATSVGLSNTAFNGLAVQFSSFATTIAGKGGNVVTTMQEMTGRAADFASVMNIDVAEAAAMFQSGLAGETEPLKKFGIDLSAAAVSAYAAANGIGTVGEELTESEKVTARYGLLMQATAKTQGDFANTSDSAANATRIAQAEMTNAAASLGAVVAPVIATVATKVADLAKGFVDLNEATGGALIGFTAFAGGAAVLVGGIASVIGRVQKLQTKLAEIGPNATAAAAGIGVLTGVAFAGIMLHGKAAADRANDVAESIDNISRATSDRAAVEAFFQMMADNLLTGDDPFKKLAESAPEAARRILDIGAASGVSKETLDSLRVAVENEDAALDAAAETTDKYGKTAGEAAKATDDVTAAAAGLTIAQGAAKGATDDATAAIDRNKRHNEELVRAVTAGLDDIEREWDELTGDIDANESWSNLQLDFMDLKTKGEEALTALKNGTEDARTKSLEYQVAVDGQKQQIIDYAKEVLKVPPERITNILAAVDAGDLERAEALLANLTRNRTVSLDIIAKGGAGYEALVNGHRASGGPVSAGGNYLVGERGPEVVHMNGSGNVIPNNVLSGGGHNVTINVNAGLGTDGYAVSKSIVNSLAEYDRRNGTHIVTPAGR